MGTINPLMFLRGLSGLPAAVGSGLSNTVKEAPEAAKNFGKGAAQSAGETLGVLDHTKFGDWFNSATEGKQRAQQQQADYDNLMQRLTPGPGIAGKAGKLAEQGAEYALGEGPLRELALGPEAGRASLSIGQRVLSHALPGAVAGGATAAVHRKPILPAMMLGGAAGGASGLMASPEISTLDRVRYHLEDPNAKPYLLNKQEEPELSESQEHDEPFDGMNDEEVADHILDDPDIEKWLEASKYLDRDQFHTLLDHEVIPELSGVHRQASGMSLAHVRQALIDAYNSRELDLDDNGEPVRDNLATNNLRERANAINAK